MLKSGRKIKFKRKLLGGCLPIKYDTDIFPISLKKLRPGKCPACPDTSIVLQIFGQLQQ